MRSPFDIRNFTKVLSLFRKFLGKIYLGIDQIKEDIFYTCENNSLGYTEIEVTSESNMKAQLIERQKQIQKLKEEEFDCLIIGGGATGSGSALEAARRGLKTALVERFDFAQGTSSRSTKLLHGGVRYLEQAVKNLDRGQFHLVKEALAERKNVIEMAPHLAQTLPLVIPLYKLWQIPYYYMGLLAYDLLSGKQSLGKSKVLNVPQTLELFPSLNTKGVIGSVMYYDGQFDDARLNVEVAMLAIEEGAAIANYLEVIDITKVEEVCRGVKVKDCLSGEVFEIDSKVVINATGPYTDSIRRLDQPTTDDILQVSSGSHIVVDHSYAPGKGALLIPKTDDGRVIFIVPWRGFTLIGTTDDKTKVTNSPQATEADIEYLLEYANRYLAKSLSRDDVSSAWSGLRPLVSASGDAKSTAKISRDHTLIVSASQLVTITGGKWTTFRNMAQDAIDKVTELLSLDLAHPEEILPVAGGKNFDAQELNSKLSQTIEDQEIREHLIYYYGFRSLVIQEIMNHQGVERLLANYPFTSAEVVYVCRYEMAEKTDDILARRFRLSFLNEKAKQAIEEKVSLIVEQEKQCSVNNYGLLTKSISSVEKGNN